MGLLEDAEKKKNNKETVEVYWFLLRIGAGFGCTRHRCGGVGDRAGVCDMRLRQF